MANKSMQATLYSTPDARRNRYWFNEAELFGYPDLLRVHIQTDLLVELCSSSRLPSLRDPLSLRL